MPLDPSWHQVMLIKNHGCFTFHHLFVYSCLRAISGNTRTVHLDLVTSDMWRLRTWCFTDTSSGFDKLGKWNTVCTKSVQSYEKWLIMIISTQRRLKFSNFGKKSDESYANLLKTCHSLQITKGVHASLSGLFSIIYGWLVTMHWAHFSSEWYEIQCTPADNLLWNYK